jgi:hypothetical protein
MLAAQFSKILRFHTLGRSQTIANFFAHINSELVQLPWQEPASKPFAFALKRMSLRTEKFASGH